MSLPHKFNLSIAVTIGIVERDVCGLTAFDTPRALIRRAAAAKADGSRLAVLVLASRILPLVDARDGMLRFDDADDLRSCRD